MHPRENETIKMVRVYELVSPDLIRDWASQIKAMFGQVVNQYPNSPEFIFHISASSAWIYYEAKDRIRAEKPKLALPKGQREAKKIADAFLSNLAKAFQDVSQYPFLKNLQGIEFIPRLAQAIDAVAVASSAGNFAEHWLVRYQVLLYGFESGYDKFVVKGSQIEVRVGNGGEIVGYNARWTPIRQKYHSVHFTSFEEADHDHPKSGNSSESPIVQAYCLFGDDIPQYYLAPYHTQALGHHTQLHSACKYALEVSFEENHTIHEMEITVKVEGGSGDYSYGWGHYQLETFLDKGVSVHDKDECVYTISPPCYAMVMCHVLDRKTMAYFYHKEQVIGKPQMIDSRTSQHIS